RNVVPLRRLADHFQFLHWLYSRATSGGVDGVAGQAYIESLAADELAVRDSLRGIRWHRDHAVAHRQSIDRNVEARRRQFQEYPTRLCCDASHRPAVDLDRVRSSRSALIHGDVGAAHDQAGAVECDIELVGHHLSERGPGALAEIGLADVERCGVVFMNDDPRIELSEIGIGIGGLRLWWGSGADV